MCHIGRGGGGVAGDGSGEIGPWNAVIIHVFQWDWHLG